MARASWKFCFFSKSVWRLIFAMKKSPKSFLKKKKILKRYHNTSSQIPKVFFKHTIRIYKYLNTTATRCTNKRVGYKFGEFLYSRKPYIYGIKPKTKKKNIRR